MSAKLFKTAGQGNPVVTLDGHGIRFNVEWKIGGLDLGLESRFIRRLDERNFGNRLVRLWQEVQSTLPRNATMIRAGSFGRVEGVPELVAMGFHRFVKTEFRAVLTEMEAAR